jgi:hypothetical protein
MPCILPPSRRRNAVACAMKTRPLHAVQVSVAALALVACSQAADVPAPRVPVLVPAAATPGKSGAPALSRCKENLQIFDRDRDRRVSLDELADHVHSSVNADLLFRQRDRDMDGFLIEREFCARLGSTTIANPPLPDDSAGRPGVGPERD